MTYFTVVSPPGGIAGSYCWPVHSMGNGLWLGQGGTMEGKVSVHQCIGDYRVK